MAQDGPQLPGAVGLTGLDDTGQRILAINVEHNRLVQGDPKMQADHGAVTCRRILLVAEWPGFIVLVGGQQGVCKTVPPPRRILALAYLRTLV